MQDLTLPFAITVLCANTWAVREDLLAHRIPNWISAVLICAGLGLQFTAAQWWGLGQGALGVMTGGAVLLPLYLIRATGAGDVKFLAALGAGLGPHWVLLAGIYTLLAGLVLAVGYVAVGAVRTALGPPGVTWSIRCQLGYLRAQEMRRERFPYALAIAVGGLLALLQRGDLASAYDQFSGAL